MSNSSLWVAGQSGNSGGRPKGSKRTFKRTIDRFFVLNISLKELEANYNALKPGKERVEMIRALLPYHIAPVQADGLNESQIDEIYSKLEERAANEAKKVS